jgi:hypothetical protein
MLIGRTAIKIPISQMAELLDEKRRLIAIFTTIDKNRKETFSIEHSALSIAQYVSALSLQPSALGIAPSAFSI